MTGFQWQGAAWMAVAGVLVAAALVGASALLVPDPPPRMALPAAGELVSLEPYLDPADSTLPDMPGVPETVRVTGSPFGETRFGGRGAGSGTGAVTDGVAGRGPGPGTGEGGGARLSAVLVGGDRPVAIVDDRLVRAGDRLDDGSRVESIRADHIIIITPAGQRRRLDLER